jgi:23S rRNA (cytidine1920-2'-O)/16S rRNA (cytidine1409-2'-O)-methyltransferase
VSKLKSERLDKLLVERALVSTRARAQAMILAGHVLVNDEPVTKAGTAVAIDAEIRLKEPELKYVSRGALKLKGAIEQFQVVIDGRLAIDVGASTGGFTEVLLEGGATQVYTVDVGTNQLAWKIRSDPRVVARENYNARYLNRDDFNQIFDVVVMDVSFISIRLILPALQLVTQSGTDFLVLFKPQFEVGREFIGEGGIVNDQLQAQKVLQDIIDWSHSLGLTFLGKMESPILGTDGNHEYLIHWKKD